MNILSNFVKLHQYIIYLFIKITQNIQYRYTVVGIYRLRCHLSLKFNFSQLHIPAELHMKYSFNLITQAERRIYKEMMKERLHFSLCVTEPWQSNATLKYYFFTPRMWIFKASMWTLVRLSQEPIKAIFSPT